MSKRSGKKGKAPVLPEQPFANSAFAGLSGLTGVAAPSAGEAPTAERAKAAVPVAKPRFPAKLVVRMEKKGRRGKTVTRISGVPRREREGLCKEMKKALGCGATIEGDDLILLGELVERAYAWFEKAGASKIVRGT